MRKNFFFLSILILFFLAADRALANTHWCNFNCPSGIGPISGCVDSAEIKGRVYVDTGSMPAGTTITVKATAAQLSCYQVTCLLREEQTQVVWNGDNPSFMLDKIGCSSGGCDDNFTISAQANTPDCQAQPVTLNLTNKNGQSFPVDFHFICLVKTASLTASCPGGTPTLTANWTAGSGNNCNVYIQAGQDAYTISNNCSGSWTGSTLPGGPAILNGGSYRLYVRDGNGNLVAESQLATVVCPTSTPTPTPTATPTPTPTPTATPTPTPTPTPSPTPTPTPTRTPTPTPTRTPTPTPTATPTPTPILQCLGISVYNESWQKITDLSTLKVGQKVYFAVTGQSSPTPLVLAKFRITVNGVAGNWQETTLERPGVGFYIQYTIPSSGGTFKVEALVCTSTTNCR